MNDIAVLMDEPILATDSALSIDLVLIGARGQVGSAFRRQLASRSRALHDEGIALRLLAAFDTRGFAVDERGIDPLRLDDWMPPREAGEPGRLIERLCQRRRERTIVIDCTASDEVADMYPSLLKAGVGIVAANKRANARSLRSYHELQNLSRTFHSPYRYETTVGAAIPLIGPLRDLRLRGEKVHSIQGVLSGSLSYVLHRMHEGQVFSQAVGEARRLGFTEPDPFDDLRAVDLSRKLLVLAREAGFMLEPEAVEVGSLTHVAPCPPDVLVDALKTEDGAWSALLESVMARGERLVVLAEADATGARVVLRPVPLASPFAQLLPGQNHIVIRSLLQDRVPLSVGGPGAGVEITAAGVLSDVIEASRQWGDVP